MTRTKIAIACQGGRSQTAFTAGALKALCEARVNEEFEIVSISGTSGGAICAALVWFALEKNEAPVWGRLMEFWQDNTAQSWLEQAFNQFVVSSIRLVNRGLLPTFQLSPALPFVKTVIAAATVGQREVFWNLRALLQSHIDFDEIRPGGRGPILRS
jgi:NTE family protein